MKRGYQRARGEIELWRGRQWVVTSRRLISYRPAAPYCYDIDAARLAECEGKDGWTWLDQVGLKTWCNFDDFIEVFGIACRVHCRVMDAAALTRSIKRVRFARQDPEYGVAPRKRTLRLRPNHWSEARAVLTAIGQTSTAVH